MCIDNSLQQKWPEELNSVFIAPVQYRYKMNGSSKYPDFYITRISLYIIVIGSLSRMTSEIKSDDVYKHLVRIIKYYIQIPVFWSVTSYSLVISTRLHGAAQLLMKFLAFYWIQIFINYISASRCTVYVTSIRTV
jgi:hypothetical protein